MIEMEVMAVGIEPNSKFPFVLLRDKQEEVVLPIGIGFFEANQISMKLENKEPPRPMTYDLMKSILDTLEVKVVKIVVNALAQSTFFAQITLQVNGGVLEIDSRPSDAIALALRTKAPIYAVENVLEEAGVRVKAMSEEGNILLEGQSVQEDDSESFSEMVAPPFEEIAVTKQIGVLRVMLKKAIENERYEEAARLRDQIRRLESAEETHDPSENA